MTKNLNYLNSPTVKFKEKKKNEEKKHRINKLNK